MNNITFPDYNSLCRKYNAFLPERTLIVRELENCIHEALASMYSRPRTIGRVKSFESYYKKYIHLLKAGSSLAVSDLIGIRVICPFLEDLTLAEGLLKKNFNVIEIERKGGDHTFREFGYESVHLLITIPGEILKKTKIPPGENAEIQIRTILQDAWAEVEHELVYKAEFTPFDNPLKRKLAAVNASLSLADIIFQEIRSYQRELNGELGKRRDSFFKKIENSTDAILISATEPSLIDAGIDSMGYAGEPACEETPESSCNGSIDELLLSALYAHNKNQFDKAISVYSQILEMKPDKAISSLIYKHRGMAFFARSHYEEAIADFSKSFRLDPKSYKAVYYKGIICSVLKQYPKAIDSFNRSLEINPYQPFCLFRRGQAYYHLEDYPQALGDCEAALALEPFEAADKFKDLILSKLKM